jgi:stage II sporulation protein M
LKNGSSPGILGSLRRGCRNEWTWFRKDYARIFALVTLVLIVGVTVGFLYFHAHPDKAAQALTSLNKIVLAKVPRTTTGPALAWAIFWNNLRASLIALVLGLFPFLCLSAVLPLINGGALGLLVFALTERGMSVPLLLLVDLAPHGVFEIAAWLYGSSLGVYLSLNLVRRLLAPGIQPAPLGPGPDDAEGVSTAPEPARPALIKQVLTSFLRVVVPLLVVAAIIEAFVTPALHRAVF